MVAGTIAALFKIFNTFKKGKMESNSFLHTQNSPRYFYGKSFFYLMIYGVYFTAIFTHCPNIMSWLSQVFFLAIDTPYLIESLYQQFKPHKEVEKKLSSFVNCKECTEKLATEKKHHQNPIFNLSSSLFSMLLTLLWLYSPPMLSSTIIIFVIYNFIVTLTNIRLSYQEKRLIEDYQLTLTR